MEKTNYIKKSLLSALATTLYVTLVAILLIYLQKVITGGTAAIALFLLLLVVSAAICGTLIFGLPIYKIVKGEAREGFKLLGMTIGWLIAVLILVGLIVMFVNLT
jgi:Na+-transporting NADH:ubiquinone oxidoreductase subunit NqrE